MENLEDVEEAKEGMGDGLEDLVDTVEDVLLDLVLVAEGDGLDLRDATTFSGCFLSFSLLTSTTALLTS